LILPSVQYYKDKIQNIGHRVTPGIGVGYEIFNTSTVEWDVSGGAGYQWTKFSAAETGQSSTDSGGAVLLATDIEWELTDTVDWDFSYNASIGLTSGLGTDHHIKTGFSFDIWRELEFDVSLIWDRIGVPQQNEDGTFPDSDDTVMYFGIGWNM